MKQFSGMRVTAVSQRPFDEVVARLGALISHPEIQPFLADLRAAGSADALSRTVEQALAPFDLMEFLRLDLGGVLKTRFGSYSGRSLRLLIGNPLTMSSMAVQVPDAGSYAPVTLLIDERPDGVHLSYDTMEAFLSSYNNEGCLSVARELDRKVLELMQRTAE